MGIHICSEARSPRDRYIFFFQAEDGIRDLYVTGVQTCALPIYKKGFQPWDILTGDSYRITKRSNLQIKTPQVWFNTVEGFYGRSEERRVGKECRSRWWREH